MNKDELISKLADILMVNAEDLVDDFELNAENWDSMMHLAAIAAIDEVCGIIVPTNELKGCDTVGKLIFLIEKSISAS
jgi:acyl carrier protein